MEPSLSGLQQVCQKETTHVNFILGLKTMTYNGSALTHTALTVCNIIHLNLLGKSVLELAKKGLGWQL